MGNHCVRARVSVQSISSICFDGRGTQSQSRGLEEVKNEDCKKEEDSKSEAPFFPVQAPEPVVMAKNWRELDNGDDNNNKPLKTKSREVAVVAVKEEEKAVKWEEEEEVFVEHSKSKPRKVAEKKTRVAPNVRRMASAGMKVGSILKTRTGHLRERYIVGKLLGQGQFGDTFLVVEKDTGKEFACKTIMKRKLGTMEDVEDVRREIEIMHHLSGNPNIISIKGAYEDNLAVHMVMELCTGGELFDRIQERGHFSEKEAAGITRIIVSVIQTCHSLGVMHRDLKPENFLFVDGEEDSDMKSIDFGLSTFFKPGEVFTDVVGSPYYVAPEVLRKKYSIEADIWSAGVIVYIILCGVPPFWGLTEQEIFDKVLHGKLDFDMEPWPKISKEAKDLVERMLVRDPRKRITAHEVLCHPWVQVDGVAPDKPLGSAVYNRLTQFRAMNKFKKMALRVIAERLSEEEIAGLKQTFKMLDADNSGQITFEELKAGFKMLGANLKESEIHDLMRAADVDNNGTLDYGEFIAATLHLNKIEKGDNLYAAFQYFDKDGSGYITIDELQKACEELGMQESHLEEMIKEADQNNDGCIDYTEFVAMMHKGSNIPEFGRYHDVGNVGFRRVMQVY